MSSRLSSQASFVTILALAVLGTLAVPVPAYACGALCSNPTSSADLPPRASGEGGSALEKKAVRYDGKPDANDWPADVSDGRQGEHNALANSGIGQFPFKLMTAMRATAASSSSGAGAADSKNELISALSVHTALGIALLGTGPDGPAQKEMAEVLGFGDSKKGSLDKSEVTKHYTAVNPSFDLKGEGAEPVIKMANQMIVSNKLPVKDEYVRLVSSLGAGVMRLDFGDAEKTITTVNDWVSENTAGKIPTILTEIEPDEVGFLLNAIYFKGSWLYPFDKAENAPFHTLGMGAKSVPTMTRKEVVGDRFAYWEDTHGQLLQLAYQGPNMSGKHRFGMYLYLPAPGADFRTVQRDLDAATLQMMIDKMIMLEGSISLPKFKIEVKYDLPDTLKYLGMRSVFTQSPTNFSAMTDDSLAISRVIHKTFISVDEQGTEAAAATALSCVGECASAELGRIFAFKADRPFLFFIRDNKTGMILFQGSVVEPQV